MDLESQEQLILILEIILLFYIIGITLMGNRFNIKTK